MIFEHSKGYKISFGYDMANKIDDPNIISWSDPKTGEWVAQADNEAGAIRAPIPVLSNDVREDGNKVLVGDNLEMILVGPPFIFGINVKVAQHGSKP